MNDDIHALSGAYAVNALDDVERVRFERHLASCVDCQTEVAALTETAAELSGATESAPPPSLRVSVLHGITAVRQLPPEPVVVPSPVPPMAVVPAAGSRAATDADRGRRPQAPRRWNGLVAAAAAAVLAVGGFSVWRALDQQAPPPTVAQQVLDANDASRVNKTLPGGASVSIVRSPSLQKAVIVTSGMPAAPSGKVYQLWLQDPAGALAPAGLMPAGPDQVVVLKGDASTATGVGITVEPDGGSPQPTTPPIALITLA